MRSPGRGFATSATRRSSRVVSDQSRASPKPVTSSGRRSDRADQDRRAALGGVDGVAREMRVREERVEGGGEGGHQVRRAERSTCGRVQIGSGLLSISSRTHSSRSRSGIVRA